VAQPRENPALGDLDGDFDLRFVTRLRRPRGDDRRAVVARPVRIRPLDPRLIPARLGDAGAQLIRHDHGGDAAKVLHGARVTLDEVDAALGARGLGVGVVGGAEHGDKEFDRDDLASGRIDQCRSLSRVVDKRFLPRRVDLAHRGALLRQPAPVVRAERRIPVPVGMHGQIFQMQELQRHARPPQLGVHPDQIGAWPRDRQRQRRPIQRALQRVVAERADGIPGERHRLGPGHHRGDRARTDPQTPGRLAVAPA
jgi:hypothetical protein